MKSDNILIWMMCIAAMLLCVFAVDKKPSDGSHVRAVSSHAAGRRDTIHADTLRNRVDTAKTREVIMREDGMGEELHNSADTEKLRWVMLCIRNGNAKKLASMITFPIPRIYPLHDIKDAKELTRRFNEIFDKSFRKEMGRQKMSKWENYGYRGYRYGDHGDLWVSDELYLINYYSLQECQRYYELTEEELNSLHDTLRSEEWQPYCCFKSSKGEVIRVDLARRKKYSRKNQHVEPSALASPQLQPIKLRGDEVFRMAIFTKGSDLHGIPNTIMYGHVKIEGSMCERTHIFKDDRGHCVTFGDPFYEKKLTLFTKSSGSRRLTPCYWLDLVRKQDAD